LEFSDIEILAMSVGRRGQDTRAEGTAVRSIEFKRGDGHAAWVTAR
jgi:hypothetical protein